MNERLSRPSFKWGISNLSTSHHTDWCIERIHNANQWILSGFILVSSVSGPLGMSTGLSLKKNPPKNIRLLVLLRDHNRENLFLIATLTAWIIHWLLSESVAGGSRLNFSQTGMCLDFYKLLKWSRARLWWLFVLHINNGFNMHTWLFNTFGLVKEYTLKDDDSCKQLFAFWIFIYLLFWSCWLSRGL